MKRKREKKPKNPYREYLVSAIMALLSVVFAAVFVGLPAHNWLLRTFLVCEFLFVSILHARRAEHWRKQLGEMKYDD